MTTKTNESQPQLKLGLKYSGSRIIQQFSHRGRHIVSVLEQFSYWRSPLVWLLAFLNAVFAYAIISFLSNTPGIPPQIPLFQYAGLLDESLFETSLLPVLILLFSAVQFIILIASFRLYYRLKDLSMFMLAVSILLTLLFYVALYKSISITLPASA